MLRENHLHSVPVRTILPIIAANKSTILHQAVYFFKEKNFERSDHLQLLIELGDEFYGFAAFDAAAKKVKAWVLYAARPNTCITETEVLHIKNEQEWLNYSYTKTIIVNCGAKNLLLPKEFYSEAEHSRQLMYGAEAADILLKDDITVADAITLHNISGAVYHLFQAQFANTVWYHKQSLLFSQKPSNEPFLTVTINFRSIFITVAQNRRWILLQSKQYQTPEDVLYHILNTIKQLGFDAEKTTALLEGMAEENSALAALLHQYLCNMRWNTDLEFEYPQDASSISKHTLALTDRLLTCVL